VIPPFSKFFILIVCLASIALADDFKTIDGKEYKNATVSRVEPDGIVLITKSGISKVYFTELPKEVQERYHYNPQEAAEFTAQSVEQNKLYLQQRAADEQKRTEERAKYWQQNPTPAQSDKLNTFGSSLDRRAYNQATTAAFLFSQYATNQINADRQYKGRILTISGTIRSITSGEETAVDLVVPYFAPELYYIRCIFNDSRGLGQYQSGNPISVTGTVDGVRSYKTLIIKDCQLHQ
jgi:putative nucleic acid binding protein